MRELVEREIDSRGIIGAETWLNEMESTDRIFRIGKYALVAGGIVNLLVGGEAWVSAAAVLAAASGEFVDNDHGLIHEEFEKINPRQQW